MTAQPLTERPSSPLVGTPETVAAAIAARTTIGQRRHIGLELLGQAGEGAWTNEYRVTYQRAGWKNPQFRICGTWPAVERRLDKLQGQDRPDLAPLTLLEVHARPVPARWTLHTTPDLDTEADW